MKIATTKRPCPTCGSTDWTYIDDVDRVCSVCVSWPKEKT